MYQIVFLVPLLLAQGAAPQTAAPKPAASKPAARRPAAAKPAAAKPAPGPALTTDEQKIIYALGLSMYRSLGQFDLSPAELDLIKRALTDSAAGKPAEDLNEWGPKIQGLVRERSARAAEKQKAGSATYLAKAAAEPGAVKTESGMIFKELRAGSGPHPKPTDTVKVNYRGTLIDGTEFDSSYKRGEPAEFPLNGVIKCWTEGVQKIGVGGKALLVCPSDLAYGDAGRPSIPPGATLVFEVELLEIGGARPSQPRP